MQAVKVVRKMKRNDKRCHNIPTVDPSHFSTNPILQTLHDPLNTLFGMNGIY
jgi:hypothetical protein